MDFLTDSTLLHLVDLVLAVSLIELLWLSVWRRMRFTKLAPNLLAGLSLTLALRLSLVGAQPAWIVLCLAAAGVSHLLDLLARRHHPGLFTPTQPLGQGRQSP
ncbi:hypothetical protein [Roseateles sp.]|uniref:hypothetical protein n=1 Tax=Roseateles sp. TaxID=1971397 RepID=UPI003BAA63BB